MNKCIVRLQTADAACVIDHEAMSALRDAVGADAFDEILEDALFEITERLSRIERLAQQGKFAAVGAVAHDVVAVAGQIGMADVSRVAASLEYCCLDEDEISARAVSERLVRIGGDSLIAAAEVSVDLAISADSA
ncbi:MAG: Hpt domain-containing protein [Pikeienuella sp.]